MPFVKALYALGCKLTTASGKLPALFLVARMVAVYINLALRNSFMSSRLNILLCLILISLLHVMLLIGNYQLLR